MATIGIHDTNPNKMTGHTRIALYDMSIEDLGERRAKRILHTTIQGAAKFLGTVTHNSIKTRMKPGTYVTAMNGKKYAVRVISDKEFNRLKRA